MSKATGTATKVMPQPGSEPPRWRVLGALLLLGSLWGSSFPLIRVAAASLGGVGVTLGRVLVAAAVLAAVVALTSGRAAGTWRAVGDRFGPFLLLAALNVAGPLVLVATAIVGLNASLAAVLNATTPLFAVAVAAVWLGQKVTLRAVGGVALGIAGVTVLVGGASLPLDRGTVMAVAASLTAALLYALGGVYTRVGFGSTPPMVLALGQQVAATALLVPFIAAAPPPGPLTGTAVWAVLVIGVGATAGGYLLYVWIIRCSGPVTASAVTLLVPVVGAGIGVAWLAEPVTVGLLAGLVTVLASVVFISAPARPRRPLPSTGPGDIHPDEIDTP